MSIDPWGDFVTVWAPKPRVDPALALDSLLGSAPSSPSTYATEFARFHQDVAFGASPPRRLLLSVPEFFVTFVSDELFERRGWVIDFAVDAPSAFPA